VLLYLDYTYILYIHTSKHYIAMILIDVIHRKSNLRLAESFLRQNFFYAGVPFEYATLCSRVTVRLSRDSDLAAVVLQSTFIILTNNDSYGPKYLTSFTISFLKDVTGLRAPEFLSLITSFTNTV